jgi:hypothetical protein
VTLTTDPNDPRLGHGSDETPRPQNETYLVLSESERAKGFVRPVRSSYRHVGIKPTHPLRDLTADETARYSGEGYVKFEPYPPDPKGSSVVGRFWTQEQLDTKGCGSITTMGRALAETYAREPRFYGATYCCMCGMHRPVAEFVWHVDGQEVGS